MKIAAIEYYPTSTKGGSEKAFFEVLKNLQKMEHNVCLFYVKTGDLIAKYESCGIKCIQIPSFQITYKSLFNWLQLFKASTIINKYAADCIYINQLSDSPLAAICKILKKTKLICHLRVAKQGNSRLFQLTGKLIDKFICVNELIKQQYLEDFKRNIFFVINDGIEIPETFQILTKPVINHAVYLGRISPEKGLLKLLDTWMILINKYNLNIKLSLTGPSDSLLEKEYKSILKKKIEEFGLNNLIKLNNPISNPLAYLKDFDFSIFPSIVDEAFGRTIPESILAGTPIFARKVGIVEDILAPQKDIFIYETEENLAFKINQFYAKELNYDLEKLKSHLIKNYDISKNVKLIEKLLV